MIRWFIALLGVLLWVTSAPVSAEEQDYSGTADASSTPNAVRVTILRMGGVDRVHSIAGGGSTPGGCSWTVQAGEVLGPDENVTAGTDPDDMHTLYVLFCNGTYYDQVWIGPDDIVDLDALAGGEAARYVEDVLAPGVSIGVNPDARGLVGLRPWFWVEGFDGAAVTVPVAALGLTVNVQLSVGSVSWDFGDGTVESGSLGEAYPAEIGRAQV